MKIGILLSNTGTPDAPTQTAVKTYLRQFLSDKRVVQIPHFIWLPILYGIILPFRSKKSAKLYKKIWVTQDSPMRLYMQEVAEKLMLLLNIETNPIQYFVAVGMNYGNPSISAGLQKLMSQHVDRVIILPLFPQYSNTTTASTFDAVAKAFSKLQKLPQFSLINEYAKNKNYIAAIANNLLEFWKKEGQAEHLLISFHGLPERFIKAGDPYQYHCEQTALLLAEALNLNKEQWTLCYQSKFGYDKWLKPSTQKLLTKLPKKHRAVDIVCPGFAVDCLETLEEINITGKMLFMENGGKSLRYVPALNASDEHIAVLKEIILRN